MAAQIDGRTKTQFDRVATRFASKTHLDPLAIEEAYKGREMLLILRDDQKGDAKFIGSIGLGGAAVFSAITELTILTENSNPVTSDGPLNNIEYGSPFILFFAAIAAWKFGYASRTNKFVKEDVARFEAQKQMKALPQPGSSLI